MVAEDMGVDEFSQRSCVECLRELKVQAFGTSALRRRGTANVGSRKGFVLLDFSSLTWESFEQLIGIELA